MGALTTLHPGGVSSGLPVALGFVLSAALMAAAAWTAARGLVPARA